jgi:hypothetical protein
MLACAGAADTAGAAAAAVGFGVISAAGGAGGGVVTSVVVVGGGAGITGNGVGVAAAPAAAAGNCGPDGCAVVAFWHAAIDAPLPKRVLHIANAVIILRTLKTGAIGNMLAVSSRNFRSLQL